MPLHSVDKLVQFGLFDHVGQATFKHSKQINELKQVILSRRKSIISCSLLMPMTGAPSIQSLRWIVMLYTVSRAIFLAEVSVFFRFSFTKKFSFKVALVQAMRDTV